VRGLFHLRKVNIVGFFNHLFNCYMFRSYNHLQADIFFLELTLLTMDQLFFRIVVIIVNDYSDLFNVSRLLLIWLLFYKLKWGLL
jgi:hypothetical protein